MMSVLSHGMLHRGVEVAHVATDLALIEQLLSAWYTNYDRIFDRQDVLAKLWLIQSSIEAIVVDLPEPVTPASSTIP